VRGISEGKFLKLAMEDPTAVGGTSLGCVDVKDCEAALYDPKQSKFHVVSPEKCCYLDQIPLKDSIANRQSTEYGVEN
jgi:hypothetical protein